LTRLLASCLASAAFLGAAAPATAAPVFSYKIVRDYPHDPNAFTQGLEYRDGFLYEGTGLNGRSSLRKERLETGQVLERVDIAPEYFGEGITVLGAEIFQLTWQSHTGFVYGRASFHVQRRFSYPGEGWGLTNDGRKIYMSDGSAAIRVLDPRTLTEKRRIQVRDGGAPVTELNELEWVEGEILANVWQTDRIARISPATGQIAGWIDCSGMLPSVFRTSSDAVLNGIAYDARTKRLFVTGKLWPRLYQIQIVPRSR
jgi:glutaminyl-peptide cyclotransferase